MKVGFVCPIYNPLEVLSFLRQMKRQDTKDEIKGEEKMNTAIFGNKRWDIEKIMITTGMLAMELFGTIMLFCGILNIKII